MNIVGSGKRIVSRKKGLGDGSKGEWLAKKRSWQELTRRKGLVGRRFGRKKIFVFRTSQDEMPEKKSSGLAEEKGNGIARNKVEKLPGLGEGVRHGRTCLGRKKRVFAEEKAGRNGHATTKRFGRKGLGKATGLEKALAGRKGLGKATKGLGRKKKSCRTKR
jgi:hypothetical protein